MAQLAPFPWSNESGIADILCDITWWRAAFSALATRRIIKSALKQFPAQSKSRVIEVADDDHFFGLVIQRLAQPRGRMQFCNYSFQLGSGKKTTLKCYMARWLLLACSEELSHAQADLPEVDRRLQKDRQSRAAELPDIARLKTLIQPKGHIVIPSLATIQDILSQLTLTEWLCTRIAEIAAACALAHPEQGPTLFAVVSQADPRILTLLQRQTELGSAVVDEAEQGDTTDVAAVLGPPMVQLVERASSTVTEELAVEVAPDVADYRRGESDPALVAHPVTLKDVTSPEPPAGAEESHGAVLAAATTLGGGETIDIWHCDQFRLGDFINHLKGLEERLQALRDRRRRLDEQRERIKDQLEEVQKLLPQAPPSVTAILATAEQTLPLLSFEQRTDEMETQLAELLNALRQLPVLADRLDRAVGLPQPLPLDLPLLAAAAKAEVANCQEELKQISDREQVAVNLCDRLCRSTLDLAHDAAAILAATDISALCNTVRFLDESKVYTPAGREMKPRLQGSPSDLIGALVAIAWQRDEAQTKRLLIERIARHVAAPNPSWRAICGLLGLLRAEQLFSLGSADPSLPVILASVFFLSALRQNDAQELIYVQPWLDLPTFDRTCGEFLRAILQMYYQGIPLRSLSGLEAPSPSLLQKIEQARVRLEQFVDALPGMDRTFHRMRVYAREQYILPLRTHLAGHDADGAQSYWARLGPLDRLAQDCANGVADRRDVDEIHIKKTFEYLEECGNLIDAWLTEERKRPRLHHDSRVHAALAALSQSRTRPCVLLSAAVEQLRIDPSSPTLPDGMAYGRCRAPSRDGVLVYNGPFVPTPSHLRAFVAQVNHGAIPLPALVADYVAVALSRHMVKPQDIVEFLLLQDELKAAMAAADTEVLQSRVETIVQQRKSALLSSYHELIIEAQSSRSNDDMIGLCLDDIEHCMAQMQFEPARNSLDLLSNEVRRFRLETDPEYQDALHFLKDAGEEVVGKPDKASLLQRVKTLKELHESRRQHIFPLEYYATECPRLDDALGRLRTRVDRPGRWPSEARSAQLAGQLDTLLQFTQAQLEYSTDTPDFDRFVERLPLWLGTQLNGEVMARDGESKVASLSDVVSAINRFAPLAHIMTLLGTSVASIDVPPRRFDGFAASHLITPQRRHADRPSREEVVDRVHELHQTLRDQAQRLPPSPGGDLLMQFSASNVTSAVEQGDWPRVLQLTAARIQSRSTEGVRPVPTLPTHAALFALALAHESRSEDLRERGTQYRRACLALLLCPEHKKEHPDLLSQAVIRAYATLGSTPQNSLDGVFLALAELSPDEPPCRWLSELLWDADQHQIAPKSGSLQLVDELWELLQGQDPKLRAALLRVLYLLRQFDALRHLAHHVRASEDLIATCVTAFERAESDPEVRPTARELVAAFRENRAGQHNTRPWDLLFGYLETPSRASNTPLVICNLVDPEVYPSGSDFIEIQLSLVPGHSADPPEQLSIELATAENQIIEQDIVAKNEYLLKQKLVALRVPLSEHWLQKEDLSINYRLTGETVQNRPIDERGQLTLIIRHGSGEPLHEHELADLWPGASGEPVRNAYFVGRERDLKTIEDHIRADTRQRSVMMMGQRRIGKTSLLLELTSRFPAVAGKVCGAFADVAGLELPPGKSMQEQLFDFLITAIDSQEVNAPIRKSFRHSRDVRRISRDLKPELSLNNALEQFVKRLAEESNGTISRIAFFIDEFDRFVQPLLSDRRAEVDKLMWSIRQIVQQSTCISVVLAGSGLQQLFTDHYEDALFGSIDQVRLRAFRWEDDREAIRDTFLPKQARDRLGCDSANQERVVRYAYDLCDGHPYFLNLLGRSAANCSKGRPLTVSMLNRTVEQMLSGGLSTGGTEIDAKRFYGHVFETLAKLPKSMQSVAKLAFAHLASRTTTEYPTRPLNELLDAPELLDEKVRGLRDTAISHLQKEQAITVDTHRGIERVRISVPLTAAAVRWDAQLIRQQSLAELRRQP